MSPPSGNSACEHHGICAKEFAELNGKLDRLDEAIRGNGKPGINMRLDRLEQHNRRHSRLLWTIVTTLMTSGAAIGVAWLTSGAGDGKHKHDRAEQRSTQTEQQR